MNPSKPLLIAKIASAAILTIYLTSRKRVETSMNETKDRCSNCKLWTKRGKRSGVCYGNGAVIIRPDNTEEVRNIITIYNRWCKLHGRKEA